MKPRTFVDVRDAARLAGYSYRQFSRIAIQGGDLKVVAIGRKWFLVLAEVDRWIEKRAKRAA
jgi:hypothetical protein